MSKCQIIRPVVDLLDQPEGARQRQLIWGEQVTVKDKQGGWAQIVAAKDGYPGYVPSAALAAAVQTTHWVSAVATHVYTRPDFKSPDLHSLSFGSQVQLLSQGERFSETPDGFIPTPHLSPLELHLKDPVAVAELFLGTPYLWGGNSRLGIDCSGLVQASLLACGLPCPGDSGPQERALGNYAPPNGGNYRRGDLLFWKGHVALVRDCETLVHANAFHMAVALEPLQPAIDRILAQGDGAVTAHKRLL
ncbi:C40 family peptidase [Parasedimentitalea psychrophila]|uniref:NlpC/P60 family protein n=1 Tax=Parasedimentitalea psychrophila TaxID=2997337 RepID=A0A9Y2L0P8_9RHOB|nr:NlpC/P60 family protein [Parasedimentitalea psychrophila]WIY26615.1 NlpC/P60 family protein [Parasedimentitalea psychrophila]